MSRNRAYWIAPVLLVIVLGLTGYWMLFSHFATYDDEGYILISARQYFSHGNLYEGVYSQYGPAFYCVMDLLQRGWGPVDHTFARLLTLGFWLGTAICCSGMVWRQTASRSLAFFTLSAVFLYLYFITDEPFHPGSVIFFILAASLFLATEMIMAGKWAQVAAVTGASGAILLLTKINAGAFYVVAIAAWGIAHAVSDRLRQLSLPLLGVLLCVFAAALMHTLIHEPWVRIYLTLFGCGAIGLLATMRSEGLITWKFPGSFLVAGLATGIAILMATLLRGTSLPGLVDGVLLGPLRHPGNYSYPVDWRPGTLSVAAVSLALRGALPWLERRYSREFTVRVIVALRFLISLGLLVGVALLMHLRAVGAIFSFVAPLIWISIIPISNPGTGVGHRASRALVAMVLLLQFLHAYPVGGAQESWGTFLFIPLVAMGLGDVRSWLSTQSLSVPLQRFGWRIAGSAFLAVALMKTGWAARRAHRDYYARTSLNLPGANQLRLLPPQAATYRILALNAVVHTDMLFSVPGMFSFNLWTGLPTPTDKNTTLWFSLLNESEQAEIIHQLEINPRTGIIVQDSLMELMRANQIPMKGPLWDYLHTEFQAVFRTDGFAFWIKKHRSVAPLNIAAVSTSTDPSGKSPDTQIDFHRLADDQPIAAIEVRTRSLPQKNILTLNAANAEASMIGTTRSGQATTKLATASWPLQGRGLVHFLIQFNRNGQSLTPADTVLYLKGSNNQDLGEVAVGE